MYRGLKVPLIYVKDNLRKDAEPRLLGTDSHDWLYIDEKTNGIQYLNLQCCEGTRYGSYKFVGEEPDGEFTTEFYIKWATVDEVIELQKQFDEKHEKLMEQLRKAFGEDVRIID